MLYLLLYCRDVKHVNVRKLFVSVEAALTAFECRFLYVNVTNYNSSFKMTAIFFVCFLCVVSTGI